MAFLTDEKLVIVGAAGMIGSNMVQSALMMNLTSNICLYDVFSPEGVAEEMRQSGFDNVNITATTDVKEAFTNAKYIISSGGTAGPGAGGRWAAWFPSAGMWAFLTAAIPRARRMCRILKSCSPPAPRKTSA